MLREETVSEENKKSFIKKLRQSVKWLQQQKIRKRAVGGKHKNKNKRGSIMQQRFHLYSLVTGKKKISQFD